MQQEALSFNLSWKLPCVIYFARKDLLNKYNHLQGKMIHLLAASVFVSLVDSLEMFFFINYTICVNLYMFSYYYKYLSVM